MDNKLTKKRLYNFFSYEWITLIAVVVASILVWELIFTVSAVRLSVGQHFKFYIDQGINSYYDNAVTIYDIIADEDTLSYDVLKIESELITDEYDVLSTRLTIQEGDVIFSVDQKPTEENQDVTSRAKSLVDAQNMYDYKSLLLDAKAYLSQFLKGEFNNMSAEEKRTAVTDYANLSEALIDDHFDERMDGDNRFRKESEKVEGRKLERARIQKLCAEVKDFEKIVNYDGDIFFTYTRGEQNYAKAGEQYKQQYADIIQQEKDAGRENAIYGLYLGKLPTNKDKFQATKYLTYNDSSDDITVMVFNFRSYQEDLQFETICFVNSIVRAFSTLLD